MADPLVWLTSDPTGKKVGAGIAVVGVIAVLYIVMSVMKFTAQHFKLVMGGAILVGGGIYAGIFFQVGWQVWLVIGVVSLAAIAGIGFAMTMKD